MMYNMYMDEIGKNQIQLIFKAQSLKTQEKKIKTSMCHSATGVFAHAPVHTGYLTGLWKRAGQTQRVTKHNRTERQHNKKTMKLVGDGKG